SGAGLLGPELAYREKIQLQASPERERGLRIFLSGHPEKKLARHGPPLPLEVGLHGFGETGQGERVGHVGAALSQQLRERLMAVAVAFDQRRERLGLLERGEVLALQVLDQRGLERILDLPDEGREPVETGDLRGTESTLARNQLEATSSRPHDDGLQEPMDLDRGREL